MSRISEFKMAKGVTVETGKDIWTKKSLQVTVQLSEEHTGEDVAVALTRAEYLIDNFLGRTEGPMSETKSRKATTADDFNPEELMKHAWKGKKDPDHQGEYLKGSTAWGWDFKKEFSAEVLAVLEKGPIKIDQYEFTLGDQLVSAKKKKDTAK